jgi:phosphonate transport system ATP-binding protein
MTAGARFRLRGVSVTYGTCAALDTIDLEIAPGEAIALVGPSGAGKTTLLGLLNGTVRPSHGTVAVDDRDLSDLPPAELRQVRAGIGFVHQDLSLVPNVRVLQNVLAGRLGRISFLQSVRDAIAPSRKAVAEVYEILERVGIPEKLYEPTHHLSGGQRQRVAIARALYQRPRALLADEPVSSVDPARARDAVSLLTDICQEKNLTLCVSLHNLDLAREFFPRLIGVRSGRIAFDRSTAVAEGEFNALYELTAQERAS